MRDRRHDDHPAASAGTCEPSVGSADAATPAVTAYDDAEFYGLALLRMAADEVNGEETVAAMMAKVEDLREQHGDAGVQGLVVALSRFGSNAAWVIACERGIGVNELLDEFAMHKAQQQLADQDDPASQ